ncbi:hypothetical protein AGR2A_Lc90100 [Agrobacterium genomosp. 2 str. CFBP 5494]|uniref:Uncharacterized protein n=1 Tax=Agrobacterium genomosp. 2 str. CFBP 5494 TaxID=1183436 RepID=A0A9W5B6F3_9HYPH|nr:hypothetical protein AGR2A_Lc90100 [Agrobacterium genomosp. 2 str. CFBP 5494]
MTRRCWNLQYRMDVINGWIPRGAKVVHLVAQQPFGLSV